MEVEVRKNCELDWRLDLSVVHKGVLMVWMINQNPVPKR